MITIEDDNWGLPLWLKKPPHRLLLGQALGRSEVWKLLQLVVQEWPLLIQAAFFLVVAAIADVLIPHYISQTISMSLELWVGPIDWRSQSEGNQSFLTRPWSYQGECSQRRWTMKAWTRPSSLQLGNRSPSWNSNRWNGWRIHELGEANHKGASLDWLDRLLIVVVA